MKPSRTELRTLLETIFTSCHTFDLIDPDPLLVVRDYAELADREIAALLCSSLALGRASAIVDACRRALAPFGPRPAAFLSGIGFPEVLRLLSGFKYRFFDGTDTACLLCGAAALFREYGSLERAFVSSADTPADAHRGETVSGLLLTRCDAFADRLRTAAAGLERGLRLPRNLVSAPRDGSACKRLMLFLRWLVRSDAVDPGGWRTVSPAELVLPLDVHLHRISLSLGMTSRVAADLRSALEITAVLRSIDPDDPIRFDFSLARLGIRSDYSLNYFYQA